MATEGDSVTYVGRVKWFNNKSGFGFVTVITEGEHQNSDVFVHHSGINVSTEQYKYLVQGEYVHFEMVHIEEGDHEWQASNVTGIQGGLLMCETRNEARSARDADEDGSDEHSRGRRRSHAPQPRVRVQGGGPREGEQWTLVRTAPAHRSQGGSRSRRPERSNTSH
tara:strand:- start:10060 stop:10557 length:498 start_codon:yes stop_codon:yes gene_type:complete